MQGEDRHAFTAQFIGHGEHGLQRGKMTSIFMSAWYLLPEANSFVSPWPFTDQSFGLCLNGPADYWIEGM